MNCPKCGQVAAPGAVDCAACGVIFSRYNPNWTPPPRPANNDQKRDSGGGVLIAFGIFVAAMIGIAVYMKKTGARVPQFVEDGLALIIGGVLIVAVVIYKFMVSKNARL